MLEVLESDKLKWIHILSPSEEDLEFLRDNYKFHLLDIEDCRTKVQRPKIDIYDDYYFLILHFPWFDNLNNFVVIKEIKIFLGKDYIITIGFSKWLVRELFHKVSSDNNLLNKLLSESTDKLLYYILEILLTESYSIVKKIEGDIESINKILFSRNTESIIEKISITRKNTILINTIFKPQLRFFQKFERGEIGFDKGMNAYWGDIIDLYQRIWDMIEDQHELIEGLSKTFDSLQTNRTNEIIKILTFFSSIILPLSFITGLYGMNVSLPLQENKLAFWLLLLLMLITVFLLVLFFKKKKWL